jgi:Zn-dependent peptidase ImmA (M78 family)
VATLVENINDNLIKWAIVRAGHDLQEFLDQYPKIQEWIDGSKSPTLRQLENFSNKVHVPFGYLFLEQPPQESLDFPFFRSGRNPSGKVSLNTYQAVQIIEDRQDWLTDYLKDNGYDPLPFVGRFDKNTPYLEIVEDIRATLNLSEDWASGHHSWEDALNDLTIRIEDLGIIMTFNGHVGYNNRRPIDVEECRGFVLVDKYCPFLFVNSRDAKSAQMFTIIHELAHVWIGESAGFSNSHLTPADNDLEKLCDQVAAEFLVPEHLLEEHFVNNQNINTLSKRFKVSPIVIGRRLWDLGYMSKEEFFAYYHKRMAFFQKIKDESQGGGGDFYVTAKRKSSKRFASFVNIATRENALPYRDAYRLMGMKGSTYHTFMNEHLY